MEKRTFFSIKTMNQKKKKLQAELLVLSAAAPKEASAEKKHWQMFSNGNVQRIKAKSKE